MTSISALRRSSSSETFSGVGTNFSFLTGGAQSVTQDADKVSTTTQEFRLASPKAAWGDVVSGVYLLHEDGRRTLGLRSLAARTGLQTASTVGLEHVRTDSHAVFADGKFNLTPGLTLGAGVRYTVDEKAAQLTRSNLMTPAASFTTPELSTRWSRWTPRFGLNWQASPNVMAYGTLTRGFTSGGYNTEATSLAAFVQPFSPETVTNQEVGLKSQWLNNRVRVNFAAFRMKYRDKQELLLNSTTGILTITNASQATVPGFEAEVAWRVLPGINITANYGQLRGRYDSFMLGNINFTGNPLASSPRHNGSVAMDWRVPIAADGVLVGAISHARTGTFNTGAANDPNLQIPGYGLTNASLGYEPRSGQWRARVWVRNAADTAYVLTRSTQVVRAEYLGEPRTFGVTLSANY